MSSPHLAACRNLKCAGDVYSGNEEGIAENRLVPLLKGSGRSKKVIITDTHASSSLSARLKTEKYTLYSGGPHPTSTILFDAHGTIMRDRKSVV